MGASAQDESATGTAWSARCPECGYDLRGTDLASKPCPECGWEATSEERDRLACRWALDQTLRWRATLTILITCAYAIVMYGVGIGVSTRSIAGFGLGVVVSLLPCAVGIGCGSMASLALPRREHRRAIGAWNVALPWLLAGWFGALPLRLAAPGMPMFEFSMSVLGIGLLAAVGWVVHWQVLVGRAGFELRGSALAAFRAAPVVTASAACVIGISLAGMIRP